MTTQIQIYAHSVTCMGENGTTNVLLNGIDPSQVAAEFSADELLETMEVSAIESYLTKKLKEA